MVPDLTKFKERYGLTRRSRLTDDKVLGARARKATYRIWDSGDGMCQGLHVMVYRTGKKSWRVSYDCPITGKRRGISLGSADELDLAGARKAAREVLRRAKAGQDPRQEDPTTTLFLGNCIEDYVNMRLKARELVSAERVRRELKTECQGLLQRPVASIQYFELEKLLAEVKKKRPYSANNLHANLSGLFTWARKSRRIKKSPMDDMELPTKPKRRERDWFKPGRDGQRGPAEAVIAGLWREANAVGGDQGRFTKVALITSKRINTVLNMHWNDIDDGVWSPPAGSHNKRNSAVPLPRLAQRILGPRPPEGGRCFPAMSRGQLEPLKRAIRRGLAADWKARGWQGECDFFWHSIRHVAASQFLTLRIAPHVARMLLDHAGAKDVHAGYEHLPAGFYHPEMLAGLELWAGRIEQLVAPAEGVAVLR